LLLLVPGEGGQRRYKDLIAAAWYRWRPASWEILVTSCESLAAPLPAILDG
jgi:hypothetical protein